MEPMDSLFEKLNGTTLLLGSYVQLEIKIQTRLKSNFPLVVTGINKFLETTLTIQEGED